MTHPLAPAVEHHARHDIRDCDCAAWVILLTLNLRDLAEAINRVDWEAIAAALPTDQGDRDQ